MLLDLYKTDQNRAIAATAQRPVEGFDPGFGGAFVASLNAILARQNVVTELRIRDQVVEEFMRPWAEATGNDIPAYVPGIGDQILTLVPAAPFPLGDAWNQDRPTVANWQRALEQRNEWAAANGEPPFPTAQEIDDAVLQRRIAMYQESQDVLRNVRTTGAGVGSFVGGMVGATADPIVASSLFMGAPWSAGILRTALIEAGIGFASDFASQLTNLERIREVEPNWGMSEVFQQSLMSGAGGAIFGGAIKGIAAMWNLASGLRGWPRSTRDAGNIVDREVASTPQSRPATPTEANVTRASTEQATLDLGNDLPVRVSPEAEAVAGARPGRVFASDGTAIDVQFEVVPLRTLISSHDADLNINPDYPVELQPRDRTRAASAEQATEIFAKFEPERFTPGVAGETGPMIVGPDNIVDSGNMRTVVLRRVYAENGERAARYRKFLEDQGFDAAGIEDPVLIARRTTALEQGQRATLNRTLNESTVAGMGPAEQAIADARAIDADLLARLQPGGVGAAGNRDFVRGFLERAVPASQRGTLYDGPGQLSKEGVRRIEGALLARAYGDKGILGRVLEDTDDNIKAIGGALADSSSSWAQMRDAVAAGEIPRGMDATADVIEAIQMVMRARDEGRPIREFFQQGEMFGGLSEIGKMFLRGMFKAAADGTNPFQRQLSRSSIAAMLRGFADEARVNREGGLFGDVARSEDEVLAGVLAKRDGAEPDMFEAVRERTTPEAVEQLAKDPAAEEAVIRQGADLAMTTTPNGDGTGSLLKIPVAREDGTFEDRLLDEIYAEADAEIAAARDIEACATGKPLPSAGET